jgi:glycosyltransferase involved in cell wall biosynthesis
LPYGIAGYLAKEATGRPLILRHAGSDISDILADRHLQIFFKKIFNSSNFILTNEERRHFFYELGVRPEKLFLRFPWGVDSKYFNPSASTINLNKYGFKVDPQLPVITYIGKVHLSKRAYQLVEAASRIKEDFLLLFVAGGPGLEELEDYTKKFPSLEGKCCFLGFVPPWQIPGILRISRCLVQLETDFPVAFHFPIQPLEALATGTCVIISDEIYGKYKLLGAEADRNILVANPKNIKGLKNLLEKVVKEKNFTENIGNEGHKIFNPKIFENSVAITMKLYNKLNQNSKSLRDTLEELKEVLLRHINL